MKFRHVVLLALMIPLGMAHSAEIYKWVDKDGKIYFADSPPPDVKSESVTVQVDKVPEPDEGELRRRLLLQQADIDAAARAERERTEADAQRADTRAQQDRNQDCLNARIRLEILEEQAPAYRDAQGNLRLGWDFDTYKGPRDYIDDADRPAEIDRARQEITELCDNPNDQRERADARKVWIYSERCAAARSDLEAVEKPSSKATDDTIEARRRRVQFYCGEDS